MTHEQGKQVYDIVVELGYNPFALLNIKLFATIAEEHMQGRMTRETFKSMLEKLDIFNDGKLKGKPKAPPTFARRN